MSVNKIISWLTVPKHFWLTVFIWTIAIGLFIQLVFLPYLFPQWHDGNGLLIGVDGSKFHRIALQSANEIKVNGWNSWQLLPEGQLVSGIASIFYVLIYPAPWSVLPINGLLNATACVTLLLTLNFIFDDRKKCLFSILPFLLFPSNLLWNTQFHNENYAIPGVILILFGWSLLITNKGLLRRIIYGLLTIFFGSLLLGLVRDNILNALTYLFFIFSAGLIAVKILHFPKLKNLIKLLICTIFGCGVMYLSLCIISGEVQAVVPGLSGSSENVNQNSTLFHWEKSAWLPSFVDDQMKGIAKLRGKFTKAWDYAGSNIDTEISLDSSDAVIRYIPRAAQIGFFAPFPDFWFSQGKKVAGSAMRLLSSFEMMLVYVILVGFPILFWRYRQNAVLWIIVFICSAMLIIYAITIPNLGALYRFRYPYLMPIVCLGLAGWLSLWLSFRAKRRVK